jgi:putative RNA 2'-phosphotransferase
MLFSKTRIKLEDGYKFYLSENKVWLTDYVPIKYLNKEI